MNKPFFFFMLIASCLFSQEIVSVAQIGQLTGQPSINNTGAVNVYGTDLGSMFLHSDGRIYFLFGDTFGPPGPPSSSGDWRSNTMAYSSDTVAADGILFDGWIVDSTGKARALLEGDHAPNDGSGEVTKIPSAGWSVQKRQYLWYMSVKQWGQPGHWDVNYAEIAYSDDNGNTWLRSGVRRGAGSNFIQVAVAQDSGFLYIWGIPAGRFGGVQLARVPPTGVLDSSAYEYYTGSGWSHEEENAVYIVDPPVGELSVIWNPYLQRWLMMYLNENKACIEARFAEHPFGPWSAPLSVACGDTYPALYGAFMHPRFTENNGETVYFLMSQYGPYNVFLMKVLFKKNETGGLDRHTANASVEYALYQNSPNPFNDQTTIRYQIAKTCFVIVKIFDLSGREVSSLISRDQTAGYHTLNWDASGYASGIYFCRLSTDRGYTQTRKIILLR